MKIQYRLEEKDFLAFQLFSASKLERIQKRRRNGRVLITLMTLALVFLDYWRGNFFMSSFFAIISIIIWVFYPSYFKWRYKRHYLKLIKEDYLQRFGQVENIEFTEDYINSYDHTGDGKIKLSEVETMSETQSHFFFRFNTNMSFIILKREIEDILFF